MTSAEQWMAAIEAEMVATGRANDGRRRSAMDPRTVRLGQQMGRLRLVPPLVKAGPRDNGADIPSGAPCVGCGVKREQHDAFGCRRWRVLG